MTTWDVTLRTGRTFSLTKEQGEALLERWQNPPRKRNGMYPPVHVDTGKDLRLVVSPDSIALMEEVDEVTRG